jgi:glycosyltransferase involved in cell wall biosynthesis
MRIGFDAKRALNNFTGLGNHARILLNAMMRDFPENEYLLFSPKAKTELFNELEGDFQLFLPDTTSHQRIVHPFQWLWQYFGVLPLYLFLKKVGLWRSWGITVDLTKQHVRLFHGLSNELPFNIHRSGIKTVVTIHDLIFLKHTEQYPFIDRQIYKLKTRYAAKHADKIIAVSNETKADLVHFYQVPENKIEVIYPSVDVAFQTEQEYDLSALEKYNLPAKYILNVGSFFPRKNHKTLIQSFALIKDKVEEDLLLVGSDGSIKKKIEALIAENNLGNRVKIVSGISNDDLPAVYSKASVFVFPSLYEGFGAPVLEALFSKVPVVASKGGAVEEAGGKGSIYIDPNSAEEIANALLKVLSNESVKKQMVDTGRAHAQGMTDKIFAQKTMQVYRKILR